MSLKIRKGPLQGLLTVVTTELHVVMDVAFASAVSGGLAGSCLILDACAIFPFVNKRCHLDETNT